MILLKTHEDSLPPILVKISAHSTISSWDENVALTLPSLTIMPSNMFNIPEHNHTPSAGPVDSDISRKTGPTTSIPVNSDSRTAGCLQHRPSPILDPTKHRTEV